MISVTLNPDGVGRYGTLYSTYLSDGTEIVSKRTHGIRDTITQLLRMGCVGSDVEISRPGQSVAMTYTNIQPKRRIPTPPPNSECP